MKPIIVGIDIGVESGLAILDLKDRILLLKSKKEYSKNEMIKDIIKIGKPVLIGCDRAVISQGITEINAKFSSHIVTPEKELTINEKKELIKEYTNAKNDHEKDALAAAKIASNSVRTLLKRIEEKTPEEFYEEIAEKVIIRKISIDTAKQKIEGTKKLDLTIKALEEKQKGNLLALKKQEEIPIEHLIYMEKVVETGWKKVIGILTKDENAEKKQIPIIRLSEIKFEEHEEYYIISENDFNKVKTYKKDMEEIRKYYK